MKAMTITLGDLNFPVQVSPDYIDVRISSRVLHAYLLSRSSGRKAETIGKRHETFLPKFVSAFDYAPEVVELCTDADGEYATVPEIDAMAYLSSLYQELKAPFLAAVRQLRSELHAAREAAEAARLEADKHKADLHIMVRLMVESPLTKASMRGYISSMSKSDIVALALDDQAKWRDLYAAAGTQMPQSGDEFEATYKVIDYKADVIRREHSEYPVR